MAQNHENSSDLRATFSGHLDYPEPPSVLHDDRELSLVRATPLRAPTPLRHTPPSQHECAVRLIRWGEGGCSRAAARARRPSLNRSYSSADLS